jgi:hypothetical protein
MCQAIFVKLYTAKNGLQGLRGWDKLQNELPQSLLKFATTPEIIGK